MIFPIFSRCFPCQKTCKKESLIVNDCHGLYDCGLFKMALQMSAVRIDATRDTVYIVARNGAFNLKWAPLVICHLGIRSLESRNRKRPKICQLLLYCGWPHTRPCLPPWMLHNDDDHPVQREWGLYAVVGDGATSHQSEWFFGVRTTINHLTCNYIENQPPLYYYFLRKVFGIERESLTGTRLSRSPRQAPTLAVGRTV